MELTRYTQHTQAPEFESFAKIPRFRRQMVITEKIDGTNAQINIIQLDPSGNDFPELLAKRRDTSGSLWGMLAGSRTRWLTPQFDNFGFAAWVMAHASELWDLGAGRHFGEWWGSGINRAYGYKYGARSFSLFNVNRWCPYNRIPKKINPGTNAPVEEWKTQQVAPACCGVVPELYRGDFDSAAVEDCLETLRSTGSAVTVGYDKPEGIVICHMPSYHCYKITLDDDGCPKSRVKR